MDYPLWFEDLKNYAPGDEILKMAETLLDLKKDVKQEQELIRKGICLHLDKRFTPKFVLTIRSKRYSLPY